MEGKVTVPYTEIGGNNMNGGIMTMDLFGSTTPGVRDDELGMTMNLTWTYPGGINNQQVQGIGWGYAVKYNTPCTDVDIKNWLMGLVISDRGINPSRTYTSEEIDMATDQDIAGDITRLMYKYLGDVFDKGDFNSLRDNYPGCIFRGQ